MFHRAARICLALTLFLAAVLLPASFPAAAAAQVEPAAATVPADQAAPALASKSALLINADNGEVIYSKEPDMRLPMASTTKMMTALLVMENTINLDEPVTISKRAAETGESSVWLMEGETLTVRELLKGLLIQSGNDAAVALAEHEAGSVEAFVEQMNARAAELGLENTHFMNPHGLDNPEHYSSAADLVTMGSEIMKYPEIREIVVMQEAAIPMAGQPGGRQLVTHNHLLGLSPTVTGVKTGYTDTAGQCIVVSATDKGVNLMLSYMGGPSLAQRNQDVLAMLQYGFDSYQDVCVIARGAEYGQVDYPYDADRKLSLVSEEDLVRQVYVRDPIEYKLILPDELVLPIKPGDKIGLVEAYEGDMYLGSTYLLATEDVPKPGLGGRITYLFESIYHFLLVVAQAAW